MNENDDVKIPEEQTIGLASELFGDKVYSDVDDELTKAVQDITEQHAKNPKANGLTELKEKFSKPIVNMVMETARQQYGRDMKKSTQNQLERKIHETTDTVVNREYGDYTIKDHQLEKERNDKIREAQKSGASMTDISRLDDEYAKRRLKGYQDMVNNIHQKINSKETVKKAAETIVETVETEKLNTEKNSIEGSVRDHLLL